MGHQNARRGAAQLLCEENVERQCDLERVGPGHRAGPSRSTNVIQHAASLASIAVTMSSSFTHDVSCKSCVIASNINM